MLRNSCFFILCLLTCVSRGQNLAAYTDNNGYFYIFDNGNTTLYEYNKPLSWQVGTNCVAFVGYNSTFKVYWNGEIYKPIDRMISNYTVTKGMVEFNVGRRAYIFNQGVAEMMTDKFYNFKVADQFFVAQDFETKALQVHAGNNVTTLSVPSADWLGTISTTTNPYGYFYTYETGRNIVAYVDHFDLKAFWNNQEWPLLKMLANVRNPLLPNLEQFPFKTAKNIVAFSNTFFGSLYVFYKGKVVELAKSNVRDFYVGDDMVIYEEFGNVKAFYSGKEYDLCKGTWNGRVKDSVAVYAMPGYFYIFNKGTIHVADDIYPSEYKMDGNTVAWIDPENNLKAFYNGEIYTLTTLIRPTGFSVAGNTVWFNTASGGNHVFWKGKIY